MYWHGHAYKGGPGRRPFFAFRVGRSPFGAAAPHETRRPRMSKSVTRESKAEQTTAAAWGIINAEAAARDAKTGRLRALREERERLEAEAAAAAKPKAAPKKKAVASARRAGKPAAASRARSAPKGKQAGAAR